MNSPIQMAAHHVLALSKWATPTDTTDAQYLAPHAMVSAAHPPHLVCLTAVLHSASFMARLRSTSRMTMLASCVSRVVLSALKSRALVSKMHLCTARRQHYKAIMSKTGETLLHLASSHQLHVASSHHMTG
jgi:hypothetical protein